MDEHAPYQMKMPQGEALHTAESCITEQSYEKMYFAINRRQLIMLTCDGFVVMLGLWAITGSHLAARLAFAMPLIIWLSAKWVVHRAYKSNRAKQEQTVHYTFYTDCLMSQTASAQRVVHYKDLYAMVETKDFFYLMPGMRECMILDKNACTPQLIEFLHGCGIPKRKSKKALTVLWCIATVIFLFAVLLLAGSPAKGAQPEPTPAATAEPAATEPPAESEAALPETPAPEESTKDPVSLGYEAVYETYLQADSNTHEGGMTAKGESYLIVNDTDDAVAFLQYDRDSENGDCALYVYERCAKDAMGGWSRQEAEILNIYAYEYSTGKTAASGKTGWGAAASAEYSALTGE